MLRAPSSGLAVAFDEKPLPLGEWVEMIQYHCLLFFFADAGWDCCSLSWSWVT